MGNLQSVQNAFEVLGHEAHVATTATQVASARAIVLPGVGAFGAGIERLRSAGLVSALRREVLDRDKPLLGICLGMQWLASHGSEHGHHEGLGLIPGRVERIFEPGAPQPLRIPHMGWNDVEVVQKDGIYSELEAPVFYFVHSYAFVPDDPSVVSGVTHYGREIVASVRLGSITATQYHPEKSHRQGLAVLSTWASALPPC